MGGTAYVRWAETSYGGPAVLRGPIGGRDMGARKERLLSVVGPWRQHRWSTGAVILSHTCVCEDAAGRSCASPPSSVTSCMSLGVGGDVGMWRGSLEGLALLIHPLSATGSSGSYYYFARVN